MIHPNNCACPPYLKSDISAIKRDICYIKRDICCRGEARRQRGRIMLFILVVACGLTPLWLAWLLV